MFGIRQRLANPYNPQKYGTCERFKATLQTMLAKVTANHSNNWDTLLPSILFAYREVPQISTKFSLFKLIYGANHKFPLCIYMQLLAVKAITLDIKSNFKIVTQLRDVIKSVNQSLEEAQDKNRHQKNNNTQKIFLKPRRSCPIIIVI